MHERFLEVIENIPQVGFDWHAQHLLNNSKKNVLEKSKMCWKTAILSVSSLLDSISSTMASL